MPKPKGLQPGDKDKTDNSHLRSDIEADLNLQKYVYEDQKYRNIRERKTRIVGNLDDIQVDTFQT